MYSSGLHVYQLDKGSSVVGNLQEDIELYLLSDNFE